MTKAETKSKPWSKTKKIDYKEVERLAGRGLTKGDIALCLGIAKSTLMRKQNEDKKFLEAMQRGIAGANAAVTGELMRHIKLGNVTAIIFYLKCRAGWKETNVIENRTLPSIPNSECTPEEAEAAYIATMRGL